MKKIPMILIICFLLLSMTTVITTSKPNINFLKTAIESKETPSWAQGNFTGTWGIREYTLLFGTVEIEFGNISGHYKNIFGPISVLKGVFYPHWNTSQKTNITGIYFFEHFIFGQLGDIDIDEPGYELKTNETGYSGYGDYNQTCFDFRLVSKAGPTFYIKGTFS
jgi:hypothetical protein